MKESLIIKEIEQKFNIKLKNHKYPEYERNTYSLDLDHSISGINLEDILNKSKDYNTDLNYIIEKLQKLKSLKHLNLGSNYITNINFIKNFESLETLYLSNNKISDISPIIALENLTRINLSYNPIKNIEIITQKKNITLLWLSDVNLRSLKFLSNLKNLRELGLGSNNITDISPLRNLVNLKELNLVFNKITSITPLKNLKNLEILSLYSNKISILPQYVFKNLKNIDDWNKTLETNKIKKPPLEIIQQGSKSIENYFFQIKKEKGKIDYLFEVKLLVIGEGGTGKTTFTRKMLNPNSLLPQDVDTTFGIEVGKWSFKTLFPKIPNLGNVDFNVNLWDFGGQKIYQGTHQIFFSDKSFYVLLTDTRENRTDFSYWLNTVQQLGGEESSLIILINKKFGHDQKFDKSGYKNYFGNLIKDVIEIDLSCNHLEIIEVQEKVKLYLRELAGIGDPLPPSWINIRRELNSETNNFISFDKFKEICKNYNVTDPGMLKTISGYFNRIGTFTHYIDDSLLQERIYLNSNWLVKTVYKVLDNEIGKSKNGRLNEEEIKQIWKNNDLHYEINKLTQLMHKFGLMYHIPNTNNYVVPAHLPTETPYSKWPHENNNVLKFIYEFDKYMPQGIMSRLIVALNHHIKDHDLVWHRGINIELNGTHAEIIEGYGGVNSFEIRIVGKNKIELLTIIRERFSEVLKPFNKLNYKQLIPCVCSECKTSNDPSFHQYSQLLKFREKNLGSQCSKTGEMVSADSLLQIIPFVNVVDKLQSKSHNLKTLQLFLASSLELKEDREQFEIFINRENKKLIKNNIFIELNIWEDFIDAMSKTRLQDEYNIAVKNSDIFVSLFFTKVGKYTAEEFEKAFSKFIKTGKPYIYTYFKDSNVPISQIKRADIESKSEFEEKLKKLEHFPTIYKNIDDLKYQFKSQLEKILPQILS